MRRLYDPSCLTFAVIVLSAACVGQAPPDPAGGPNVGAQATTSGTASSKATAAISTVTVCANASSSPCTASNTATNGAWLDVMSTTIKTSGTQDLIITPSFVTGLYTSTTVTGNNTGSKSSATAMGGVSVRVMIDNTPGLAEPDSTGAGVTYDERIQTLTANLGNIFTSCFANGGTTATGCTLTPEQITLALQTTSAHSFGFVALNLGAGVHSIDVQAQVNTQATGSNGGVAIANALFGLGSLTVEKTQLVNSFSF
jgi:hypothetical protein